MDDAITRVESDSTYVYIILTDDCVVVIDTCETVRKRIRDAENTPIPKITYEDVRAAQIALDSKYCDVPCVDCPYFVPHSNTREDCRANFLAKYLNRKMEEKK